MDPALCGTRLVRCRTAGLHPAISPYRIARPVEEVPDRTRTCSAMTREWQHTASDWSIVRRTRAGYRTVGVASVARLPWAAVRVLAAGRRDGGGAARAGENAGSAPAGHQRGR